VITCPLHGAQFDVTTGRKVKDFNLSVPSLDKLPKDYKRYTEYALNLVASIKTQRASGKGTIAVEGQSLSCMTSVIPSAHATPVSHS